MLGALSDRFGRRPVILLSNFGLGLDYILMALAPTLGWLFVGRVISGITAASFTTAGAYIADVTPPEQRAARFGMLGAAFGVGFVVGPALGGLLGDIDPRLPFWVAAGSQPRQRAVRPVRAARVAAARAAQRRSRGARRIRSARCKLLRSHHELWGLAWVTLPQQSRARRAAERRGALHGLPLRLGHAARSAAARGRRRVLDHRAGRAGRAASCKALGERRTMLVGLVCGALGFAIQALAPTGALYVVGIVVMSLWGLIGPALQGLMTRLVEPVGAGPAAGREQQHARHLRHLIGPLLFTQIFASFIVAHRGWNLPGAPFLLSALLLVGALVVALRTMATQGPG